MSDYKINITRTDNSKINQIDFNNIQFGRNFSDHMLVADYYNGDWQDVNILPYGNLSLSPACNVFHYGQAIFEGMKAFYKEDGSGVVLFRPEKNWERMNLSATRMSMPTIPKSIFMDGIKALIDLDRAFVPNVPNSALYIRPVMFATEPFIGVKTSDQYKFVLMTSPVGAYYGEPISVLVYDDYIRATKGGYGYAKAAGNYAGTLYPVELARKKGYKDVLWLDGEHKQFVQEVGTMNIFFVLDGKLVTPALDSAILDGITRNSVIQLAKDFGYTVEERPIDIQEIADGFESGKLTEIFGTGTAVVINPVDRFGYHGKDYSLDASKYEIAPKIKNALIAIQKCTATDEHGWVVEV